MQFSAESLMADVFSFFFSNIFEILCWVASYEPAFNFMCFRDFLIS